MAASARNDLPFKVSPNVTYSRCVTDMKESPKFGFIWTIKKFSQLPQGNEECIESSTFSAGESEDSQWKLQLFPRGQYDKYEGYVALFLKYVPKDAALQVRAKIECFILTSDRKKWACSPYGCDMYSDGESCGCVQYITRDELMMESKKLLPNDTLTICCEIIIVSQPENTEGRHNPISFKETGCPIIEFLDCLLGCRDFNDVVLVTEGREMHAHKALLAAGSPVFAAMFKHDMQEKLENRVVITDIDYSALREMIGFMYTGKMPVLQEEEKIVKLLAAADKYALEELKLMCEQMLAFNF